MCPPSPGCILETPHIIWPKSRAKPPSGRLIEVVFGQDGWSKGKITPGIVPTDPSFSDGFYLWTWRFCKEKLCTECFDEGRVILSEGNGCTMVSCPQPLFVRMKSYFRAWTHQKEPLRRTIFLLALIGENGARPNGYFKGDIARIAGISPRSKSVDTLLKRLTRWGFISRQKRRGRTPRYWYRSAPSKGAVRSALDEAVRDEVRDWLGFSIMQETKKYGSLQEGKNYTALSMGHLVGPKPPRIIIETIDAVSILASNIYRRSMEKIGYDPIDHKAYLRSANPELDSIDLSAWAGSLAERLVTMYNDVDRNELLQLKRWEQEQLRAPVKTTSQMLCALFDLSRLFDSEAMSWFEWSWEPEKSE